MRIPLCLIPALFCSGLVAHADVVNFSLSSISGGPTPPFIFNDGGLTATLASDNSEAFLTTYGSPEIFYFDLFSPEYTFNFSSTLSALAVSFITETSFSPVEFDLFRDGAFLGSQFASTAPNSGGPGFGTANLSGNFDQVKVITAGVGSFTATTATPEPSTFALLGSGMLGAAGALWRKRSIKHAGLADPAVVGY